MAHLTVDQIIAQSMARTLFVTSYADEADNWREDHPVEEPVFDTAGAGEDWMDVAPETPQEVLFDAYRLMGQIEAVNNISMAALFAAALRSDGRDDDVSDFYSNDQDRAYAESFGHYLVMEALGHGVSWTDDHAEIVMPGLKETKYESPHFEVDSNSALDAINKQIERHEYWNDRSLRF